MMKKILFSATALLLFFFVGISGVSAEVGGTITKSVTTNTTQPISVTHSTITPQIRATVNNIVVQVLHMLDWKNADGTITFSSTSLSTYAGCNTMSGMYTIDGTTFKVGTTISTLMACAPELMNKDQKLAQDLSRVNKLTFVNGKLVISGGGSKLSYTPSLPTTVK